MNIVPRLIHLSGVVAVVLAACSVRADTFFVVASGNASVQRYSSAGTDLGAFATTHLTVPTAAVVSPTGDIWVTDDQSQSVIEKYAVDGTDIGTFANTNLVRTYGLVFDSSNNLYAANFGNGTIEKFAFDGTDLGAFATGIAGPVGMVFDGAGNLYVANYSNNTVTRYSSSGSSLGTFASTGLSTPYALAFDAGGNLYVSNVGNNTVRKFSPTGADLGTFINTGTGPTGLVFDAVGNLYVSNEQDHDVQEFSPSGASLGVLVTTPTGSSPSSIVLVAGGGTFQFALASYSVNESAGSVTVSVNRSGTAAATVDYATADGTAVAGIDYTAQSGTLTWAAGDTAPKTIQAPIIDRELSGSSSVTFSVVLSNPTGGNSLGAPSQAIVSIAQNDTATAPTISLASPPSNLSVTAGATIPLVLSAVDPAASIARVQFLIDGERTALILAPGPYTASATAPTTAGPHTLTVTAANGQGVVLYKDVVTFTVVAADPATPAPTAAILADLGGRFYAAGADLPISVTATSGTADAQLQRVDFYADGVLFASDDGAGNPITSGAGRPVRQDDATPVGDGTTFTATFTLPGASKLVNIIAVALDKIGRSQVSAPVSVQSVANVADNPPVISLDALTDGERIGVGFPLSVPITVIDLDSIHPPDAFHGARPRIFDASPLIQKVEYFLNALKAKEDDQAPYTVALQAPATGTYVLTVIATDGAGLATASKPIRLRAVAPVTVNVMVKGEAEIPEGAGKLKALFSRDGMTNDELTVYYKASGSATNGVDYLGTDMMALSGTATVPAGETSLKLKLVPHADSMLEGTETVKIKLLPSPTGEYIIGAANKAKFLIEDPDLPLVTD